MIHQLGYKREMPHPNLIRVTVPTLSYEGLDYTGGTICPYVSIYALSKSYT